MAMRKEPERRYVSADQFADDLKRYLKGLPVRAHPDSATYRTIKFMRRHAAAVIAGGVFVFAFVAGVVGITAGLIMARRERDRARESFRQAREAVNQFFTRVTEERLLNQPGLYPLRKTLLEDAQQFYEDFLSRRSGDPLASSRTSLSSNSCRTDLQPDRLDDGGHRAVPAGCCTLGQSRCSSAGQSGISRRTRTHAQRAGHDSSCR